MSPRFRDNPAYVEYVRLLHELHFLMRDGKDESPEGEALRDQMDWPWRHLSGKEVERVRGMSADLYTLEADSPIVHPTSPVQTPGDYWDEIQAARSEGNYDKVLALLRDKPQLVADDQAAFYRGLCYSHLGDHETAVLFHRHAVKVNPESADYAQFLMRSLETARRFQEAGEVALKLAKDAGGQPHIRAAAAHTLLHVAGQAVDQDADTLLDVAGDVFRELIGAVTPISHRRQFVDFVYMGLVECKLRQNKDSEALDAVNQAVSFDPQYDQPLVVRGLLQLRSDPSAALDDFQKAVDYGTRSAWPYLYVAHDALSRRDHQRCIQLCAEAMSLTGGALLLARLYEWTAIAMAELSEDRQLVLGNFDRAMTLASGDERIRQNYQKYHQMTESPNVAPAAWDVDISAEADSRKRALQASVVMSLPHASYSEFAFA